MEMHPSQARDNAVIEEYRSGRRSMGYSTKRGVFVFNKRFKKDLMAAHDFRCAYCGMHVDLRTMSPDHIHPVFYGGTDHVDNIACACRACNSRKGSRPVAFMRFATNLSRHPASEFVTPIQAYELIALGVVFPFDPNEPMHFEKVIASRSRGEA